MRGPLAIGSQIAVLRGFGGVLTMYAKKNARRILRPTSDTVASRL
jgi:hypothetical protein